MKRMTLALMVTIGSVTLCGEKEAASKTSDFSIGMSANQLLVSNPRAAKKLANVVFLEFYEHIIARQHQIEQHKAAAEKYRTEGETWGGWVKRLLAPAPEQPLQLSEFELLDQYKQLCPYFGLVDTLQLGEGSLTWSRQSDALQWFTKTVVDAVGSKLDQIRDRPIQLAGVGKGRGFMDAVILATILQKYPHINLTFFHDYENAYSIKKADATTNERLREQFKEWFVESYPGNTTVMFCNASLGKTVWSKLTPDVVYARDNAPMLVGETGQRYDMVCKNNEQQNKAFAGMMIGLVSGRVECYGRGELASLRFDSQAPHRVDVLPPIAPAKA